VLFVETTLEGAFVVEPAPFVDKRGIFARTFCAREFGAHGLVDRFVQCSASWNASKCTLRGMHYQESPSSEVKLVRCTRGRVWDVIVDLRPESNTYLSSFGAELSADNRKSLYIPEMFAHGFLTLEDESEVFYQMSEFYAPELSRGLRFDDPKLAISWPGEIAVIAEKDLAWGPLP
jgi:dTDP-4-dehydrorhamnose 3,5-epimerase